MINHWPFVSLQRCIILYSEAQWNYCKRPMHSRVLEPPAVPLILLKVYEVYDLNSILCAEGVQ